MSRKKQSKAKVRGGTKVKPIKATVADTIERPTPEQERRVEFERRSVRSEMGQTIGVAYRRRPLFETMADQGGTIAPNELEALRYYRTSFDRAERSATKSCLNFGVGGRSAFSDIANVSASMIDAKRRIAVCESVLGPYLPTMRAVVLEDRSFTDIAIERFGSRDQDWIVDGQSRTKIVPRSGRHREIVRQEFLAGMRRLQLRLARATNMLSVLELWVEPEEGTARIMVGHAAPQCRYRLWGSSDLVAEVRDRIQRDHGVDMGFATPEAARCALDAANDASDRGGGRLVELDPEELAA